MLAIKVLLVFVSSCVAQRVVYVDSLVDIYPSTGSPCALSTWPLLSGTCSFRSALLFCDAAFGNITCNVELPVNKAFLMKKNVIALNPSVDKIINIIGNNATVSCESEHDGKLMDILVDPGVAYQINFNNVTFSKFGGESLSDPNIGGIMSLNGVSHSTFSHVTFDNNCAGTGGAISFENCANITFFDSIFQNNFVINSTLGGGAVTITNSPNFNLINSTFVHNSITGSGNGGAFYVSTSDYFSVVDCVFSHNNISESGVGGAIFIQNSLYTSIRNTIITHNSLNIEQSSYVDGGGVYITNSLAFQVSASDVSLTNSIISHNTGGGVYLYGITGLNISNTEFKDNAYIGLHLEGCDHVTVQDTSFSDHAVNSAFNISTSEHINILNSHFERNYMGLYITTKVKFVNIIDTVFSKNVGYVGGAVYIFNKNWNIAFKNCVFTDNAAYQGGAFYLDRNNQHTSFIDCYFANNNADDQAQFESSYYYYATVSSGFGGAGFIDQENYILTFSNCNFTSNGCVDLGGALYFKEHIDTVQINNCNFDHNVALNGGGAIVFKTRHVVSINNTVFAHNSAMTMQGGAVLISDSNQVQFSNVLFDHNYAGLSGGAVAMLTGNAGNAFVNCTFTENTAVVAGGGIYALSTNDNLVVDVSRFYRNTAALGGGFYVGLSHSNTRIVQCEMIENTAIKRGGAVYIANTNVGVDIHHMHFEGNTAINGGGMYLSGFDISVDGCTFHNNSANINAGALFVVDAQDVAISDTTFISNTAVIGGGAVAMETTNDISFTRCIVSDNKANTGGGLNIYSSNNIVVSHCQIAKNTASMNAGGVYFDATTNISVLHSEIAGNYAGFYGGGLYYGSTTTEMSVKFSVLHQNVAIAQSDSGGGAIHMLSVDAFYLFNSTFYRNAGRVGGAINIPTALQTLLVEKCHFDTNIAGDNGGSLAIVGDNITDVRLEDTYFARSAVAWGTGGAVDAYNLSSLAVVNCTFDGNFGGLSGGAVAITGCETMSVDGNVFTNNIASMVLDWSQLSLNITYEVKDTTTEMHGGSALFLSAVRHSLLNGNVFRYNAATLGGGTVYWEATSLMPEPVNMRISDSNLFEHNAAMYGLMWATEGLRVVAGTANDVYNGTVSQNITQIQNVTVYIGAVHTIVLYLVDYYNQIVTVESTETVSLEARDQNSCLNATPSAFGGTIAQFTQGVADFTQLQLTCTPRGNLDLTITSSYQHPIEDTLQLRFRTCKRGEYYFSDKCYECEYGSYSLRDNDDLSVLGCDVCPEDAEMCYKDQIILSGGYWRISPDAHTLLECPLADTSCNGTYQTGNAICSAGYEGPLCAVCGKGYYYNSFGSECTVCPDSHISPFAAVVIALFSLMFSGLIVLSCFVRHEVGVSDGNSDISPSSWLDTMLTKTAMRVLIMYGYSQKVAEESVEAFKEKVQAKFKIYVTLYQIISTMPSVLNLKFPPVFNKIANVFKFANFNFTGDLGLTCKYQFDAIDQLFFSTVAPIIACLLLYFAQVLHVHITKNTHHDVIKTNYFFIFLVFTYMILPGVTTNIFLTFSTQNVDPDDVVDGIQSFMRSDYSVSTQSAKYILGYWWAIAMIFVYPFGIPAMYYYLLYEASVEIMTRKDDDEHVQEHTNVVFINHKNVPVAHQLVQRDYSQKLSKLTHIDFESTPELRAKVLPPLKFLYDAYEPQYWYWEVIETFQRLLLTGFLVLIVQGSPLQIIVGMVISLLFTKLYGLYKPFEDDQVDWDKELAQWQVFATLFLALIIKGEFFENYNHLLNFLIVIAITFNAGYDTLLAVQYKLWQSPRFASFANARIAGWKRFKAHISCCHARRGRTKLPVLIAKETPKEQEEGGDSDNLNGNNLSLKKPIKLHSFDNVGDNNNTFNSNINRSGSDSSIADECEKDVIYHNNTQISTQYTMADSDDEEDDTPKAFIAQHRASIALQQLADDTDNNNNSGNSGKDIEPAVGHRIDYRYAQLVMRPNSQYFTADDTNVNSNVNNSINNNSQNNHSEVVTVDSGCGGNMDEENQQETEISTNAAANANRNTNNKGVFSYLFGSSGASKTNKK